MVNRLKMRYYIKKDRTDVEQKFYKSIANATHNEFMDKLVPIIF